MFKKYKSALAYLLASGIQKLGHLLLLPLLILSLTKEDFSRYGLFTSLIAILPLVLPMNLQFAPTRLYFDYKFTRDKVSFMISTFIYVQIFVLLLSIPLVFIGYYFGKSITTGQNHIIQLILIVITIGNLSSIQHALNRFRILSDLKKYILVVSVQSFVTILIYLIFYYMLNVSGYYSVIISYTVGTLLANIVGNLNIYLRFKFEYLRQISFIKTSLIFTWPTVVHALMIWILPQSGRWFGLAEYSLEDLSNYILLMQIVTAATIFARAVYDAKLPDIGIKFAEKKLSEGMKVINESLVVSLGLIVIVYLILYLLTINVIGKYIPYEITNEMIILGFLINISDALYLRGIQTLNALKKTKRQALATTTAGITTLLITPILLSKFGVIGLLMSTVAGYMILAFVTYLFSQYELKYADGK